jgi:hypothetical protein
VHEWNGLVDIACASGPRRHNSENPDLAVSLLGEGPASKNKWYPGSEVEYHKKK